MEFYRGEFRGKRRNVAAQDDRGNRNAEVLREALTGGQSFPRGSEKLPALVFRENQNIVRHNGGHQRNRDGGAPIRLRLWVV